MKTLCELAAQKITAMVLLLMFSLLLSGDIVSSQSQCTPDYCQNGGTCEHHGILKICNCLICYGGDQCQFTLLPACFNPDLNNPICMNGGTCVDQLGCNYICECPPNFTGDNCETPIQCQSDSCYNGGTCSVVGNEIVCACPPGYSGDDCSIDLYNCTSDYCQNGGTCVGGDGVSISCSCSDCFDDDTCEIDLSYCPQLPDYCKNGGTCIDGYGCDYSCNCIDTYQGDQCKTGFCPEGWCFNGGSCVVEDNLAVCQCALGCDGDRCENDNDVCTDDLCQNGGTCSEDVCFDYTCSCPPNFTGDNCESLIICQSDSCHNEGTCSVEANKIVCACPPGYSGDDCIEDLDHCTSDYCKNGGTCVEGIGIIISCNCSDCFDGDTCEIDLSYCPQLPDHCMNGGTCVDGYGCDYSCNCPPTFTGDNCETAVCPEGWCFNGGTCIEELGDNCEFDNDVCDVLPQKCLNGATCNEGLGDSYTCSCADGFDGFDCGVDDNSQSGTILHNGTILALVLLSIIVIIIVSIVVVVVVVVVVFKRLSKKNNDNRSVPVDFVEQPDSNGGIDLPEYKVDMNGSDTEKTFINDKSERANTQFATITAGGVHK